VTALLLLGIAAPQAATAEGESLTIRGRFLDADGSPVAGARLTISGSYGLVLGSGGFSFAGDGGGGYPGCSQNCVGLAGRTDRDGRFEVDAPADIVKRRDEIRKGDTSGFSVTAYAPVQAGDDIGAVVEVSQRLERGDRELTLPTMQVWRPEMRTEPTGAGQVRLRWSKLPKRYGRVVSQPAAGIHPSAGPGRARRTGQAAARVNLLGLAPGSVWVVSATSQVGDESNVTFGSPPMRLPAPPVAVTRGKPCLVIGTAGTALRGPCALTDGDPKTAVGRVFRSTCTADDVFCEPELPGVVAVDLGAETELALVRGTGECMFSCELVLSSDGRTWHELDAAALPTPASGCRGNPAQALPFGIDSVVPPAGTRARYVGLSGAGADHLPLPRGAVGALPARSEAFDPEALHAFDAVAAAEISVFSVAAAAPEICDDTDEDVPFLGLPSSETARERNAVGAKVAAGLLVFLVALGVVRARQRVTRRPV
jgi:hypothetical protein